MRDASEGEKAMTNELPIACTLSEPERRERASTTLAALRAHVRHIAARPDGYELELAMSDEALADATALIQLERRCCPFLRFALTVEPGGDLVQLALTGPPGTRELLSEWLEPATP
jgi:hypothetical protein